MLSGNVTQLAEWTWKRVRVRSFVPVLRFFPLKVNKTEKFQEWKKRPQLKTCPESNPLTKTKTFSGLRRGKLRFQPCATPPRSADSQPLDFPPLSRRNDREMLLLNYSRFPSAATCWPAQSPLPPVVSLQVLNPKKKGKKKKYVNSGTVSKKKKTNKKKCCLVFSFLSLAFLFCFNLFVLLGILWLSGQPAYYFSPSCLLGAIPTNLPPILFHPITVCVCVYQVTLLSFKVESEYTFVDFIRGGWVE